MNILGKEIGDDLEPLVSELVARLHAVGRELRVQPFEGDALSDVDWDADDGAVVVSLHRGVPRHALPHVLGVALQHVRQRLDGYPAVVAGPREDDGAELVRQGLREFVFGGEAEAALAPLALDRDWETEQRHRGLKALLREVPPDWEQPWSAGANFAALLYGRFGLDHPAELWEPLRREFHERLPQVAERGEAALAALAEHGWGSVAQCHASLVAVRDALGLGAVARIQDRATGEES